MAKFESFTDGTLLELALAGDREAIVQVSQVLVDDRLAIQDQRLLGGFVRIAKGSDPNCAFDWQNRGGRHPLSEAARAAKKQFSPPDIKNDLELFNYVMTIFKRLAVGREPNDAFFWTQERKGARVMNCNALRDWDIGVTYHNLMRENHGSEMAIEVIHELTNLEKSQIWAIIEKNSHADNCLFPEDIFPLPTDQLIKQNDIETALAKVLKNNK
jgi:hypothetical protein